jgi:undecaprenyl diphosphate synthase
LKQVPDVVGMTADEAALACRDAGLQVALRHTGPPLAGPGEADRERRVLRSRLLTPDTIELLVAAPTAQRLPRLIPTHIAIICDGNGRWARSRGLSRDKGHRAGTESIRRVIEWCADLEVKYLSFYIFSTENWRRPADEVDGLMNLITESAAKDTDELVRSGVRIRVLGQLDGLPPAVRDAVNQVSELTAQGSKMVCNLLVNYGGRAEIVAACRALAAEAAAGARNPSSIDEAAFEANLLTVGMPDPDLVIRTAGDIRLSNFLLWQSAYSELHFAPVLWPDFTQHDLLWAIDDYSQRQRRFGGLVPEDG